jgi:hypothetical protein
MKHVRLRVGAGGREAEIHPMYDLLANAPFVDRATALQWHMADEANGVLHHVEGDPAAFEAAVEGMDAVVDHDLERTGESSFYAYIRGQSTATLRSLLAAIVDGEFVIVPPVVYREDGTVSLSMFGPAGAIQSGVEAIPDPVTADVVQVGGLATAAPAPDAALTDRQREAAEAAVALGYYDVPRSADHEAVAEAIGCAPSTAAEHLRKAESKLLRSVLGGH